VKMIIAGSRSILVPPYFSSSKDYPALSKRVYDDRYADLVRAVELSGKDITEIVSGGADGGDKLGENYAVANGINLRIMRPNYEYGRAAPIMRNHRMGDYVAPDGGVIALWDGESRGTKDMLDYAEMLGLYVFYLTVPKWESYLTEVNGKSTYVGSSA